MNRTYCLFSCSFSPSSYISQHYGCYSLAGCPLPYVAGTTLFFLFSSLYCFYAQQRAKSATCQQTSSSITIEDFFEDFEIFLQIYEIFQRFWDFFTDLSDFLKILRFFCKFLGFWQIFETSGIFQDFKDFFWDFYRFFSIVYEIFSSDLPLDSGL